MAESNINNTPSSAALGLNLDNIMSQIRPSQYTYALNAVIQGFDGNSVTVQNEEGNILCTNLPEGYKVVGARNILEKDLIVFWLATEDELNSEIGVVNTNTCLYTKKINDPCIGLSLNHPILKSVYRLTHRGTEVYWTDGNMPRRFIDLDNLPFLETTGPDCQNVITTEIDCNKMNVQPNFSIPELEITDVDSDGETEAGSYQFAIQYANALSEAYTSYYSVTNPIGLFDPTKITQDFNYKVNKSIDILISNLDQSGYYDYFNLAVIKTVNNITTPYLVGTYKITSTQQKISYTGQNQTQEALSLVDINEKYPVYATANDVTTAQDILIWSDLVAEERINYQAIASQIKLLWETHRLKYEEAYQKPELIYPYRGYMRDEVYPFEVCFLLDNGLQTDGFHIPARVAMDTDLEIVSNEDSLIDREKCEEAEILRRWQVYNTATLTGFSDEFQNAADDCYTGAYQYGEFAYWQSEELYPCDIKMWGSLANTPIRHHKFPDSVITQIHDTEYIYPIGVQVDINQINQLIQSSSLTQDQKNSIVGFKILRGNRANNKSVVAKGLIHNVLKYTAKNNQIDYTSGSGGGNYSANPVYGLVDRALDLVDKAYKTIVPIFDTNRERLENVMDTLNFAKTYPTNSPIFTANIQFAINKINEELGDPNNDTEVAYLQGALEVLNSALQTADAYSQLGDLNIDEIPEVDSNEYYYPNYLFNDIRANDPYLDNTIVDESSKSRYTFHSPDTHFYQPSLGTILKLETAESGFSNGHIVEVKKHSKYQFVNSTAYISALIAGVSIGFASGTYGLSTNVFNGTAAMTAYQAIVDIIFKITPHKNFAYQYNAIGNYTLSKPVLNNGNKQRAIDIGRYLQSGVESVGDNLRINNYQRENSVYVKTNLPLPYVNEVSGITDISKTLIPSYDIFSWPISSYYASIKKAFNNQYGQIYSYDTIDTGFQRSLNPNAQYKKETIFGGDIFINQFAYKSKIPFFIDNRVGEPDDSDISYNELSNVGRVKYWFSTDATERNSVLNSIFGVKAHRFYWNRSSFFSDNGSIFLFAYGIPNFFCESEVNVDYRQAYNDKEGDFFPRVSKGIPDDWLQEYNVSIANDNTYLYNKSFSKQNQYTNTFTHLPPDFFEDVNRESQPYRAIFSEKQEEVINYRRNNWLVYRPAAKFDFPQNYGKLTSLDGIENKQVLARFENKTLLYNALQTIATSTTQAYLGQSLFSQQSPPLDYADTDLGFVGSQHKFLLKTEYGHITIDSKRGQIFILSGQQAKEISNENVSKFLTEFLPFEIQKAFSTYNIDNHFNGVGLHGVYDSKYDRILITKLDYKPLLPLTLENNKFFYQNQEVELTDTRYFCNNSFTLSYSFITNSWSSFHSYLPNYYIGSTNCFYSGNTNLWKHNSTFTLFNNFYGTIAPYIIEYPIYYKGNDEILQGIKDYSKILKYTDYQEFVETDDEYFSEAIIYNNQQCSGTLKLTKKPKNNLQSYSKYPVYNTDSKEILFTKSNSFYNFNTFWALQKNSQQPMWLKSCESLSIYKELNNSNMNYSKRSFNKAPLMAKDTRIRLINNTKDSLKFVSQFIISSSQISYK